MPFINLNSDKFSYRADIDGLRGIAIIFVLLYHFFPKDFIGGFVGVDIFFIISGYLITGIIYRELQNDNFSFIAFYIRRIRRIFPALITVLISCLIFGWFILLADEYKLLAKHIIGSTLFINNFILWQEVGYFDQNIILKPLAHLWSLAVEEQFYFIWPLLLWFTHYVKTKLPNIPIIIKNNTTLLLIIILISISYYYNVHDIKKSPSKVFYLPLYRFWELLSGGFIAYLSLTVKNYNIYQFFTQKNSSIKYKNLISIIAISIASIILFKLSKNFFPGKKAIAPVLVGLLFIIANENALINKHILSSKFLVFMGLISYPLYLWHWPILSSVHILGGSGRIELLPIVIFLSISLAFLTYKFIENPIRHSKLKTTPIILLTVFSIISMVSYVIYKHHGYPKRKANSMLNKKTKNFWDDKDFMKNHLLHPKHTTILQTTMQPPPKYLLIGDSHTGALGLALASNDKHPALTIYNISCLPFREYVSIMETSDLLNSHNRCLFVIEKTIEALNYFDSIEYVVLISELSRYLTPSNFKIEPINSTNNKLEKDIIKNEELLIKGYIDIIKLLQEYGKKIVFMISTPVLDKEPMIYPNRLFDLSLPVVSNYSTPYRDLKWQHDAYTNLVAKIKEVTPDILIFDSWFIFCNDSICLNRDLETNESYYHDTNHLSTHGGKLLAKNFLEWLAKQK